MKVDRNHRKRERVETVVPHMSISSAQHCAQPFQSFLHVYYLHTSNAIFLGRMLQGKMSMGVQVRFTSVAHGMSERLGTKGPRSKLVQI